MVREEMKNKPKILGNYNRYTIIKVSFYLVKYLYTEKCLKCKFYILMIFGFYLTPEHLEKANEILYELHLKMRTISVTLFL